MNIWQITKKSDLTFCKNNKILNEPFMKGFGW